MSDVFKSACKLVDRWIVGPASDILPSNDPVHKPWDPSHMQQMLHILHICRPCSICGPCAAKYDPCAAECDPYSTKYDP